MYPPDKLELPKVPADHRKSAPAPAFGSAKAEQDKMTDAQRRQALQAYYAATTFMDAQVGRVLDALDRLKLADKTIVVFISDHGYHLGEHGPVAEDEPVRELGPRAARDLRPAGEGQRQGVFPNCRTGRSARDTRAISRAFRLRRPTARA